MYIPKVVGSICRKAGLDGRFVKFMGNMWEEQKIYTKLAGHFAEKPDTPSNSLAQGCSFSLIATNIHTSIWSFFLCAVIAELKTSGFVDDVNMLHKCEKALNAAFQLTLEFNKHTGHEINQGKSSAFSTDIKVRTRLRRKLVPVPGAARCLGHQHKCTKANSKVVHDKAVHKYMRTVDKIAFLPVDRERKIKFCRTAAIKQLTFSTLSAYPSKTIWQTARRRWLKAIFADTRKMKATEVVLALHLKATHTDPQFASVAATILDLHRIFKKRDRFGNWFGEIRNNERESVTVSFGGPAGQLLRAFRLVGASIDADLIVHSSGRKPFFFVGFQGVAEG